MDLKELNVCVMKMMQETCGVKTSTNYCLDNSKQLLFWKDQQVETERTTV